MVAKKDFKYEVLSGQLNLIDEQIKILQDSKTNLFKVFGITHQTYYNRRKKLLQLQNNIEEVTMDQLEKEYEINK